MEGGKARIEYRPLGPILAVMPWNFPIWQVLRGAVPTLLAGNTYVLKHAPNVMGSAYLLLDAFKQADFPEGVFEVINVTPEGVSRAIADPRIAAVTLTGSVRAGMAIGAQAGAALKKCVLELGGSDPFIVLNDADLDEAVQSRRDRSLSEHRTSLRRSQTPDCRARRCRRIYPQVRRSHPPTGSR